MSIRLFCVLNFIIFFSLGKNSYGQKNADTIHYAKIAVCIPLYIDSAFNGNIYKWEKNHIASYAIKGLEFYNGVQAAIDSLQAQHIPASIFIIDTKAKDGLETELNNASLEDMDLLIGVASSINELQVFAKVAYKKNIPFISATYPNDGNITDNPFFVIINTTLQTHIANICSYLKKYNDSANIIFCTRKGSLEETIWNYVEQANSIIEEPLAIQKIFIDDSSAMINIKSYLKKDKLNICIAGSLNESFATSLVKQLSTLTNNYNVNLFGMPNWDGIKALSNSTFKSLSIVYTSPFNYTSANSAVSIFKSAYKKARHSSATDMLLKGFECTYHFVQLVANSIKEGTSLNISDNQFKVFNDFDIQAVYRKKKKIDYFENKRIYFMQQQNGQIKLLE